MSSLTLGITGFWNFSNPLSGCKVTKIAPAGAAGAAAPAGEVFYLGALRPNMWLVALRSSKRAPYCLSKDSGGLRPPESPSWGRWGGAVKKIGGTKWGDTPVLEFFKNMQKCGFGNQIHISNIQLPQLQQRSCCSWDEWHRRCHSFIISCGIANKTSPLLLSWAHWLSVTHLHPLLNCNKKGKVCQLS